MLLLLDGCAKKPTQTQLNEQLFQAAGSGNVAQVQALLAAGADVNAKMPDGSTALMAASTNDHVVVVQALLAASADVNAKGTTDGVTALMLASLEGHVAVVQALLATGADVNAKIPNGWTALMGASL
ncbi:MAG: ankyrin repeat domain-containing protein, partial [Nitrospira sp.]|nr:ankyrin repeat domain-containing protein [Nitrospira sp.]